MARLFAYQREVIEKIRSGTILCGPVGSGKSITSLFFFFNIVKKEKPRDLYIITTAAKRDSSDWLFELSNFEESKDTKVVIDSWNNIKKYKNVENSFFIFDEQRVVGSGVWVRSFIKISRRNKWILLSGTPGDSWMDYVPVFVANGFYSSRYDFIKRHVVLNTFTKFPKIERYVEIEHLEKLKSLVLIRMNYVSKNYREEEKILVEYDVSIYETAAKGRWNPFTNKPIKDIGEYCHILRRVVNSDESRLEALMRLMGKHSKIIVFYNFDYELEKLRLLKNLRTVAEHNGHKHESIPSSHEWLYLVQYLSGAEAWNCVETNVIVFYSLTYSYRLLEQSKGRIDRLNSPFNKLFYYILYSDSSIDRSILESLKNKKNFNEKTFVKKT